MGKTKPFKEEKGKNVKIGDKDFRFDSKIASDWKEIERLEEIAIRLYTSKGVMRTDVYLKGLKLVTGEDKKINYDDIRQQLNVILNESLITQKIILMHVSLYMMATASEPIGREQRKEMFDRLLKESETLVPREILESMRNYSVIKHSPEFTAHMTSNDEPVTLKKK